MLSSLGQISTVLNNLVERFDSIEKEVKDIKASRGTCTPVKTKIPLIIRVRVIRYKWTVVGYY